MLGRLLSQAYIVHVCCFKADAIISDKLCTRHVLPVFSSDHHHRLMPHPPSFLQVLTQGGLLQRIACRCCTSESKHHLLQMLSPESLLGQAWPGQGPRSLCTWCMHEHQGVRHDRQHEMLLVLLLQLL
jgi:hypothetical protein